MKKILFILGIFSLSPHIALAQSPVKVCVESTDGRSCPQVSATNPFPVTGGGGGGGGVAGSVTQTSVSITNASTTLSAAAAFTNFGKVCVPATASTGVWVRWDGGTAGVVPPAEYIPPGQCDSWIKASGYLPNQQWNAISNSAATIAVTLIGN